MIHQVLPCHLNREDDRNKIVMPLLLADLALVGRDDH